MKSLLLLILFSAHILPQNFDSTSIKKNPFGNISKDSLHTDTTGIVSTKKNRVKADTLAPLQQMPLSSNSWIISNHKITHFDYRYAGDILTKFPFSFIKDLGFIGQRDEIILYAAGKGGISFLQDGILFNNPYSNSLDLCSIQSESIDSIEIIPSPRGFLYGIRPNPVSLNFITKDFLSVVPYTRVKYYQGAGETFIDGFFSALLMKDLNVTVDITNKNVDSTFTNTDFGIWQAKAKLKYYISNSFNIIGSYSYVKINRGLNGGINVDSIAAKGEDLNSLLYDEGFAPVNFINRKQEYIQHFFNLRLLSNIRNNLKGNIDFYFRFDQDKTSNIDTSSQEIKHKNKIYGLNLRERFSVSLVDLDITANYEHIAFNSDFIEKKNYLTQKNSSNNFSLGSILSLKLLNGNLIPSIFYRYFKGDQFDYKQNLNGLGTDLTYKLDNLNLYAGYSNYEEYFSKQNINNYEAGITYSEKNFFASLKFFDRDLILGNILPESYYYRDYSYVNGLGLEFNYIFKPILLETDAQYFLNSKNDFETLMPKLSFNAGIFYKDTLFHRNLDLKTGFLFCYTGKQYLPQIYSPAIMNYFNNEIPSTLTIDFTLAGEIQKAAIVYFTWENLLNKKYFITPFYPMPSSNIRFGISWELFN